MSLHYGYTPLQGYTYPTPFVLPWDGNYGAPRLNWWSLPIGSSGGFPQKWMFGGWLSEKSEIRLINHVFDTTATMIALKLKYTLSLIMWDGSTLDVDLIDKDLTRSKIPNHNHFIINEKFNISQKVPQWKNIALMNVKFKQLATTPTNYSYNNLSTLTLVVVHFPK